MNDNTAGDGHRPLAYKNEKFLDSPNARSLRILSEYLEPYSHFQRQHVQDTVAFFGSARVKEDGPMGGYYSDARQLARMMTEWAMNLPGPNHRFVVCSGGGPGVMEAANRGASEAGGKTVGLNIGLPFEQRPNPYITPELSFEFHYFFMRKFWFAYLAKALVVFPGGFGTLDEMSEILTLAQTHKLQKKMTIVLYGSSYWKEVLNLPALVKYGMIAQADLDLFQYADSPGAALRILQEKLTEHHLRPEAAKPRPEPEAVTPDIAKSLV